VALDALQSADLEWLSTTAFNLAAAGTDQGWPANRLVPVCDVAASLLEHASSPTSQSCARQCRLTALTALMPSLSSTHAPVALLDQTLLRIEFIQRSYKPLRPPHAVIQCAMSLHLRRKDWQAAGSLIFASRIALCSVLLTSSSHRTSARMTQ
jgi:hypothetical protein